MTTELNFGDSNIIYFDIPAMKQFTTWIKGSNFVLEKNDCSRLHLLSEAILANRVLIEPNKDTGPDRNAAVIDSVSTIKNTFIVRHDWAAAFAEAVGITDEWRLPFDHCAFEFRISGRTVIAIFSEDQVEAGNYALYTQIDDYWVRDGFTLPESFYAFVRMQVKSICIALDAEVATHTVVRAPAKLNEKRISKGRPPLLDYHVVDLSKRHRIANPGTRDGEGGKKRLHFRRGHWRHFETSKTWVKWCLVGDPDLGFVSKHYTL